MQSSQDVEFFSKQLRAEALVLDASSFRLISRPRVCWARLNGSCFKNNPVAGQPFKWSKHHGIRKLLPEVPKDDPSNVSMQDLSIHASVLDGSKLLPCLVTTAPNEEGREPPKQMWGQVSPEVRQRWLAGLRQYAPWMFEETAMVRHSQNELTLLPAEVKDFAAGATRDPEVGKVRHRLLGSSWHVGCSMLLLHRVLVPNCEKTVDTPAATPAEQTLGAALEQSCSHPLPVIRHVGLSSAVLPPVKDEWEHCHKSSTPHWIRDFSRPWKSFTIASRNFLAMFVLLGLRFCGAFGS